MKLKKVKFQTLGCRVNQYETQAMREKLFKSGFVETKNLDEADLFVLNTCTVTAESDRKSRYLIRKMHRVNPETKIIVTGCYAERNVEEILEIEGVTEVLRQNEKDLIVEKALLHFDIENSEFSQCRGQEEDKMHGRDRYSDLSVSSFEGRARAFVKIQDGCNHACAFCKVVIVRGRARSRRFDEVVEEAETLVRAGFKEVVLAGIQLGAYGDGLGDSESLASLCRRLLEVSGLERLRLSSIEPTDVSDELIQLMAESPKFCPHLHIALQSGDAEVLKNMNRRYGPKFYKELVHKINRKVDFFALTCDVMTGFPGETQEQFQNTIELLNELKPLKIHAFPYSPREGTRAARMEDTIEHSEADRRIKFLQAEGRGWQSEYLDGTINTRLHVLVEEKVDRKETGEVFYRGRTPNYILVEFNAEDVNVGEFAWVEVKENRKDRVFGELVS